jgi:hypothetical protein
MKRVQIEHTWYLKRVFPFQDLCRPEGGSHSQVRSKSPPYLDSLCCCPLDNYAFEVVNGKVVQYGLVFETVAPVVMFGALQL